MRGFFAVLGILVLQGCAGDPARFGCALSAFGAGVNGQPAPRCVEEMQARNAGVEPRPASPVLQCWRDGTGQNMYCQQR